MIDFKKRMDELEKQEIASGDREVILDDQPQIKKRKRATTYIIVAVVLGLIFSGRVIMSSQSTSDWLAEKGIWGKLSHLVPSGVRLLKGEELDRINILLLGMGGEGHDGAYLADTIMIASLKPSTKQVSLVSIPRDLTVPIEGAGWRKVNHINALAEAAEAGSGGPATMTALGDILQLPIHYYIRVDFNGFMEMIDEIGGIDVYVENTLDDYAYPIFGEEDNPDYYARFEHLHIDQGWQKMSGSLALKYARSRHAYGIEGSDFARARRQQLVIEAVKNKLLSKQTLLNPVTVGKLINQFDKNIATNLEVWEMLRLWNEFKDVNKDQIINKVLSDAPDGFLVSSISSEGAYILVPVTGNFGQIRTMFQDIFGSTEHSQTEDTKNSEITKIAQSATVSVKNGTWITGLAGETAAKLEQYGLVITDTSNAPTRDFVRSEIFDLTYGNNNEALEKIKEIVGAEQSFNFPAWIKDYQETPDASNFILILGTEADK